MMRFLLILAGAWFLASDAPIYWTLPYSVSTERVYMVERAAIATIEERGPDGPLLYTGPPTTTVTMRGHVYEGELTLTDASLCWRITMRSDDAAVSYIWHSSIPCTYIYFPIVGR